MQFISNTASKSERFFFGPAGILKPTVDRGIDADWSSNDVQIGLAVCLPMVVGRRD